MDLSNFFNATNIAIIGVSRNPNKIGHVIFRNLIDGEFNGNIFVVNPNVQSVLGYISYKNISQIKENIDLAVIAVPAKQAIKVANECGRKKIKDLIIISAGFKEIGNNKLESALQKAIKKYKLRVIGPNCLGILNTKNKLDTLFLPHYRLKRPKFGGISFVCQSGAVGSTILDLASKEEDGFSKFVSYGNAIDIDESDLVEYLTTDENTKVICLYVEAIKDSKKFMNIMKEATKRKPVIVVKGGLTEEGNKATLSHTGSLAGSSDVYLAAFKQTGMIYAPTLEDMFNYARILESSIRPKNNRIQIITNGGGYGIICTDAVIKNNLRMAEPSSETKRFLKKNFPPIVIINNPMDLTGDATTERYRLSIEACLNDKNIDILLLVVLYQTPLVTTDVVDVITEFKTMHKKPIVVVSTGGEFTQILKESLQNNGVPCFTYPENAVRSIKALVDYYL
ncbi:CoA-binding protein [Candidatus Woesearchaeota archaeon]|nr:CoA-binding protein [Candidatus Woesearchaeota archaeon]